MAPSSKASNPQLAQLGRDAAKCVSCGLCVPQCPTWSATHNEANSPRGRIMMMAALAKKGKLDGSCAHYLDACLGCGRCEDVCPSSVPYMGMLHAAKAHVRPHQPLSAQVVHLLTKVPGRNTLMKAAMLGKRKPGHKLPAARMARTETSERVTLFEGCFGPSLDTDALQATKVLLAAGGVKAEVSNATCCGALSAHAGDRKKSEKSVEENRRAFSDAKVVLSTASGCALELYRTLGHAINIQEAGDYICANVLDKLKFNDASGMRFLVHCPCTQRRMPGGGRWVNRLLAAIPGLDVQSAAGNDSCCGAGGLAFLAHPKTAAILARKKLADNLALAGAGTGMVSANYGCRIHLQKHAGNERLKANIQDPLVVAASLLAT